MRGNMVKAEENAEELKSRLAKEICSITSRSCTCSCPLFFPGKSEFVDWYRVLCVQEDAGIDAIKRRYHQLALQIHPDKNKHPNAEVAFKLVSKAYECLSNTVRRVAFDIERANRICTRCKRSRPSEAPNSLYKVNKEKVNETQFSSRRARQEKVRREMQEAIKEEAKVVASSIRICHQRSRKESPIFDPAMYKSPGYPHRRMPVECCGFLDSRHTKNDFYASTRCNGRNYHDKRETNFPVYENCNRNPRIFPNKIKHAVLKV